MLIDVLNMMLSEGSDVWVLPVPLDQCGVGREVGLILGKIARPK
jgi:hypothetical protein